MRSKDSAGVQHQEFAPAEQQRDDLVEEKMPDRRCRSTWQRTAAYFFPVARNQEIALIGEAKQIILAACSEFEPYSVVPG